LEQIILSYHNHCGIVFKMSNHFIQQYTSDQIPFYVNMRTGVTSWTLPPHAGPDAVKYITHLTDQGVPYYEDVQNGSTSWTLPLEKLSTAARRNSMAIKKMDRRETDAFMAEEEKNQRAAQKQASPSSSTPRHIVSITEEDEDESVSDTSGSMHETVSRAPFSVQQAGSESESNTDYSSKNRQRTGSGSSTGGRKAVTPATEDSSKRFSNMATLSPVLHGTEEGLGAFSDDESEANTTVTTASSAGPDQRTLRAQKRKEAQQNPATEKATPVVRGKSPGNTPEQGKGGSSSNIAVQKANVRVVFERYCEVDKSGEDVITPLGLQELCVDYGTFLSLDEVLTAMKTVDDNFDGVFQYEEFMVWWRNNPFGHMKKNNPETQKTFDAAAAFKHFDQHIHGNITRQEFAKLHREVHKAKLTTLSVDDCIDHLDSGFSGVIHFNDFMHLILHPPAAGASNVKARSEDATTPKKSGSTMSKFFGAFSGGKKSGSEGATEPMVEAKDHVDYSKYFRLVDFGGNIVDVREQMRQAGLDDAIIHNPSKMIPARSVKPKEEEPGRVVTRRASVVELEDLQDAGDSDFDDDESDGMSLGSSLVSGRSDLQLAEENAFTNAFKKKKPVPRSETPPTVTQDEEVESQGETAGHYNDNFEDDESDGIESLASSHVSGVSGANKRDSAPVVTSQPAKVTLSDIAKKQPAVMQSQHADVFKATTPRHLESSTPQQQSVIEVFLRKPLGLTLGENEPDEPLGVHVSKVVEGGSADKTGQIEQGMVLLRACGEDVTAMDFDEVMDILREAARDEELCLVFETAVAYETEDSIRRRDEAALQDETGDDESDDDEPPSEDDEPPTDEDEHEDEEEEVSGKELWAQHELLHGNGAGQEESKQESLIEVNVERVTDRDMITEHSENKDEAFSSEDEQDEDELEEEEEEAAAMVQADPLARANSMFGGISDSDTSDDEESNKPLKETANDNLEVPTVQNTSPSPSTSPSDRAPLSHSSSFKARRLAAMQSVRVKQAGGQPITQKNKPAEPLENSAIIDRVSAPPRRNPTPQRSSSLPPEEDSPSSLPRRNKSSNQQSSASRRYSRMLGSEDEDEVVKEEANAQPNGTHSITPQSTVTQSPEESTGIPRRKRSIVVDPNERRYERLFSGGDVEDEKKEEVEAQQHTPPQDSMLTSQKSSPPAGLRMGTVKKTSSGYSLSGLSLGAVGAGSGDGKVSPTSQQSRKEDENSGQSETTALPRRRGGSALKSMRSRRALSGDNHKPVDNSTEGSEPRLEAGVENNEDKEAGTSPPQKRHSRSGKILNKQLNLLWRREGKDVIAKSKEEASPSRKVKEEERVKPEEFRRRRQSFSQTTPLDLGLDQEEEKPDEESHSIPSVIEEASHSTATSSFTPSVTHKPISTFEMDPALTINSPARVRSPQGESLNAPSSVKEITPSLSMWDNVDDEVKDDRSHEDEQKSIEDLSRQKSPTSQMFHGSPQSARSEERQEEDKIEMKTTGCQSDYVNFIDDKYLNSYQMLLGEKQEVSEMQEKLYAEMKASKQKLRENEAAAKARVDAYEQESLERVAEEEGLLRGRMEQVEDIIASEKQEIDKQWEELRAAEQEAYAVHAQKTQELLDLMHIVSAHHERVMGDKKKIARQRLHLDMALQDINRFTKFSPDMSGKIGTVKYVNTRTPAIGPSLAHASSSSSKGFNSSATRLMPSPSSRGGLSPSRRTTSSMQSVVSHGSLNRSASKGQALSRSQI